MESDILYPDTCPVTDLVEPLHHPARWAYDCDLSLSAQNLVMSMLAFGELGLIMDVYYQDRRENALTFQR